MSIVLINGSPSEKSRGATLLERIESILSRWDIDIRWIHVRELPARELLLGNADEPTIRNAIDTLKHAQGVVLATPVYKASYSGLLKSFIDVLPRDAFDGKTILPIATGGTAAHTLVIDYAFRPVIAALHPFRIVPGVFAADAQFVRPEDGVLTLDEALRERIEGALVNLLQDLKPLEPLAGARPLLREPTAVPV